MRIRINDIRISLLKEQSLREAAAKKLGLRKNALKDVQVLHRAVDARRKQNVCLLYHVVAEVEDSPALRKKMDGRHGVSLFTPAEPEAPVYGSGELTERPVVIGAGPAGLVAALELARYGYRPLLLERGKDLAGRVSDVERFWRTGEFNPASNVQFGMGGAGTFSDGKLTTRVNDPVMGDILQSFVDAGAPKEILTEHKPHVGTDKLRAMVAGLTREIVRLGGEIRCETQVTDFRFGDGKLQGLELGDGSYLPATVAVLACGHSARDTYEVLASRKVAMEAKAFAIGLRVEHPQELIDRAQYGDFAGHPRLGPADYALVYHTPDRSRAAYSFCMCPGGQVVAAASETGHLVVNGMSLYHRDSGVANSALVVNVTPEDFGASPLDGVRFQRQYEALAFRAGGGDYRAPAQSVSSFLSGSAPEIIRPLEAMPSYLPGVKACDLKTVLPDYVSGTLGQALAYFDRRVAGFAGNSGMLTGVETRTSAPVRILRGRDFQSLSHKGLYPCGEGCGYAGGIMSASLDGYHVARAVMALYRPFDAR